MQLKVYKDILTMLSTGTTLIKLSYITKHKENVQMNVKLAITWNVKDRQ